MPDSPPSTPPPAVTYRSVPRPRPSFARRCASYTRTWARHTFSRESLLSSFKTFLWVAVLTPLIWIYAEREQLATSPGVEIKIEPRNGDAGRVVTFGDAGGGSTFSIRADLSGPHGRLEQVQKQLETSGNTVQIDVGPRLEPGTHRISTRSLSNDPLFVSNGVTVTNAVPTEVTVFVDPIDSKVLPVQPPPDPKNSLGKVTFEPRVVRVFAPRSFFAKNPNLAPQAELQSMDAPGSHEEAVNVVPSLTSNIAAHVTISPATVAARYDVRKKDTTVTIAAMPVWVTYPPGDIWKKYLAEYPPTIQNIHVTGPEEIVKQLNDPEFEPKPHAFFDVLHAEPTIDLTRPDANQTYNAHLRFDLPPGVQVVPEDASSAQIKFQIKPVKAE